jgi:putative hydrolase of the HAD superfamily
MTAADEVSSDKRRVPGNDATGIRAVLFDFGGVISVSPFEAFATYERDNGLPSGFLRDLNSRDHHSNAWARLERGELTLSGFAEVYEAEAAAAGHQVNAAGILALLGGALRPNMVDVVRRCRQHYLVAVATNNFAVSDEPASPMQRRAGEVLALFDDIIESSKIGYRKPELAFYLACCQRLDISPEQAVFIDDLGVNLKPARQLGMTTIKFVTEEQAIADLSSALQMGFV